MTEEEMFNKWWHKHYEPADIQIDDLIKGGENIHMPASIYKDDIKQAYLAGLHEGQPKWHDLRKDPNDLPVLETELLCQKYSGRCFVGYYHHNDNKFYPFEKGNSYDVTDVIAWCEIPTFKE